MNKTTEALKLSEEAKVIEKMQQDEIIRMAIDAGLGEYLHLDGWRFTPDGDDIKSLERFYELAYATGAAHEREACAKVCDEHGFLAKHPPLLSVQDQLRSKK